MKILLQRFWERKIDWNDPAPSAIKEVWQRWRMELPCLLSKKIPRCYFPKNSLLVSKQLHGFSDASEDAYPAVIYLRMIDSLEDIQLLKPRFPPSNAKAFPGWNYVVHCCWLDYLIIQGKSLESL